MTKLMKYLLLILLFVLAACGEIVTPTRLPITLVAPEDVATSTFDDPRLVEGEYLYNLHCGHCHGFEGQGQLAESIQRTLDLGMLTVPPHDETGHTWQHPDQLLLRTIQEGVRHPLDQFPMPAYGQVLTDEQIMNIIEYMRLWWTDEQREHQAALTANWAALDVQLGIVEATEEAE